MRAPEPESLSWDNDETFQMEEEGYSSPGQVIETRWIIFTDDPNVPQAKEMKQNDNDNTAFWLVLYLCVYLYYVLFHRHR